MNGLAKVLAAEFDEWLFRMHGVTSSCDHKPEAEAMAAAVTAFLLERLDADEVREAVEQAQLDLLADNEMWIGADGQPLDYLPEREARIGNYLHEATTAALAAVKSALGGAR